MKEVTELIEALQQRLKNAGGGEIVITHEDFTIRLGNPLPSEGLRGRKINTSFVSKTRNL